MRNFIAKLFEFTTKSPTDTSIIVSSTIGRDTAGGKALIWLNHLQ